MFMNNVKEKNVDNVIPFRKQKSGFGELQEHLINKTIIRLNDYLKRINKFSVRELTECDVNGLYEDDNSGVFDRFDILEETNLLGEPEYKPLYECYFDYNKKLCVFVYKTIGNEVGTGLRFPKRALRNETRRRQIAIWIVSNVFSHLGEEVLDDIFFRGVFAEEHNFILYD
jgi:hypothetical protein